MTTSTVDSCETMEEPELEIRLPSKSESKTSQT